LNAPRPVVIWLRLQVPPRVTAVCAPCTWPSPPCISAPTHPDKRNPPPPPTSARPRSTFHEESNSEVPFFRSLFVFALLLGVALPLSSVFAFFALFCAPHLPKGASLRKFFFGVSVFWFPLSKSLTPTFQFLFLFALFEFENSKKSKCLQIACPSSHVFCPSC
jgi:hypothetical protein